MFYRLSKKYRLRGWERASSVLIDEDNQYEEIGAEIFSLLLFCDGETDLDALSLSETDRQILEDLFKKGIIESCDISNPVDEEQKYIYYDNRFVRSVFWSITGKCNYRCRHCYLDAPEGALGEITEEEAMSIIDQMKECGVLQVDISGGEPLVRKDFWRLITHLRDNGIMVRTLYTNGALLTEDALRHFIELGLKPEISISFDGLGWHDWMRNVNGAEKMALRALKLCNAHGFSTDVEMCIHKGNRHTLRETINVLSEYGVGALKTAPVTETALWRRNAQGKAITVREYFDTVISYIPYFYQDGMPMDVTLSAVASLRGGSTDYRVIPDAFEEGMDRDECRNCYLCASARFNTYIAPDGRLLPCMPMAAYAEHTRFPKVQDIGLRKGISDSYYLDFVDCRVRDLERLNKECAECRYFFRCGGGCRANALSIGDVERAGKIPHDEDQGVRLMGRDPYQCILFKEEYVDRIYETIRNSIERYCARG